MASDQVCDGVIRMRPIGIVERSSRETARASDIDGLRAEPVRLVVERSMRMLCWA